MAQTMIRLFMIGFVLWVLDGSAPPYQRGTFPDYAACVAAGRGAIDTLRAIEPTVTWECLPSK
jgi:hypothetical protein